MPDHPQLAGMTIGAARDLLAQARSACECDDRASEGSIHKVRVQLKHVRAYWRLMRFAVGKKQEQAGNARCATAARMLADARDREVMRGTVAALRERAVQAGQQAPDIAPFDAALEQVAAPAEQAHPAAEIDWPTLIQLLEHEQAAWAQWTDKPIADDDIRRALDRTYRKARRGYKRVKKSPDADTLHGWRKWVKRYHYQLELINPDAVKTIAKLDKLGEHLGQFQDLAVLHRHLGKSEGMDKKHRKQMRGTIEARQGKLLKKSLKAGKKLFKARSSGV